MNEIFISSIVARYLILATFSNGLYIMIFWEIWRRHIDGTFSFTFISRP